MLFHVDFNLRIIGIVSSSGINHFKSLGMRVYVYEYIILTPKPEL